MRIKVFYVAMIVFMAFSFSNEWKVVEDQEAFKKQMKSKIATLKTLQADFVQTKHLSFMEQDIISNGNFAYENSDKLLWQYTTPVLYKIVMNGTQLMIKDGAGKKIYDTKENVVFEEVSKMMSSGLSGEILEDPGFTSEAFVSGHSYKVVLTPLKKETLKFLNTIELVINKSTFIVEELNMLEPGGDFTNIAFKNPQYNKIINESIFSLD